MDRRLMPVSKRSFTLLELVIAMALAGMVFLSIYSIDLFGRSHVISSNKRTKVQNEISNAFEFMSKYIYQGNGTPGSPAISLSGTTGFRVRVDCNTTQTPANTADDTVISFDISSNTLTATCNPTTSCPFTSGEVLTNKLVPGGCSAAVMPATLPASPAGMYVNITNSGATVEVGLVARYKPNQAISVDNPQLSMKSTITSVSASTH